MVQNLTIALNKALFKAMDKYLCICFDSKETTYTKINVQNFAATQKMLMQNFLSQKNACKNKSSKIFDHLVRVHNNKGLELCGREGTGE